MASEIYPAVRRFLVESGLTRSLKAFDKETAAGDDAGAVGLSKKKAKAISKIELIAACQLMLEASAGPPTNGVAAVAVADAEAPRPKKRKRDTDEALAHSVEEGAAAPAEADALPSKKRKTQAEEVPAFSAEPAAEASREETKKDKKKKKKEKEEKTSGVPFSRVDDAKWRATIQDNRLVDNTHLAKVKFGDSVGDSWGDSAAVDLLKVKGKGFRKEMAKKKRASWRGGGELDQGVNSIAFPDSSDDE